MKDIAESKRVGKRVRARRKQCYRNAFRVICYMPEYAEAEYVEGMTVTMSGLPFEHGWVEKEGMIVDPTLPSKDLVYFPGLRFRGLRGLAEALGIPKPKTTKDLPIFLRFGWGGINSPEFRSALIAGYRFSGYEDLARLYEGYEAKALPA